MSYFIGSQFFRVIHENLMMTFTEQEENALCNKYVNPRDSRMVNWMAFCKVIDIRFDETNSSNNEALKQKEYLGTDNSLRPLTPCSEQKLEEILQRSVKYCKIHGMNVRDAFKDFDPHNIGRISHTHFFRNFPGPPELTEEEMNLLLRKYADPHHTGQVTYLNMHFDVLALTRRNEQESLTQASGGQKPPPVFPQEDPHCRSIDLLLNRCRVAVFKFGIRTTEFFRDYDKLRSGFISEAQFKAAIHLAVGKEAQLQPPEINQLVNFYRDNATGKVNYKAFCDAMENAFNVDQLDKKVHVQPDRPPKGALGRMLGDLSPAEDDKVRDILSRISDEVRRRRMLLYPYFKDFDRSKAFTGVMTKNQFARVLSLLGLDVSIEDVDLLARKFSDPTSGDVNYPSFIQVVEPNFEHSTIEREPYVPDCTKPDVSRKITGPADVSYGNCDVLSKNSNVTPEELLARIRHIVLTKRRRLVDFFVDFDPLRHGRITIDRFRRTLDKIGLSKLGEHDLTEEQFCMLVKMYQCPNQVDYVNWIAFAKDVESVFSPAGLEQNPNAQIPPSELFLVPEPGTIDWNQVDDSHRKIYCDAVERLRMRIEQRRLDLMPPFNDYDKLKHGHITRNHFRQVLARMELPATMQELEAMEARWFDDKGFNYRGFLTDVQPERETQLMYIKRLESLRKLQESRGKLPEKNVATDLEGVLFKMRSKVIRDRVSIANFIKDFDRFNTGRVKPNNMRRALDLCGFGLAESEYSILENLFRSPADPSQVDWIALNNAVEAVFTPEPALEKKPSAAAEQLGVVPEWRLNVLTPEDEDLMVDVLNRLAERIAKWRLQLHPPFQDFDRTHNGYVSKPQFRRALTDLRLGDLLGDHDFGVLCQKFDSQVGGRDDVNYMAFCDVLYTLANINPRMP